MHKRNPQMPWRKDEGCTLEIQIVSTNIHFMSGKKKKNLIFLLSKTCTCEEENKDSQSFLQSSS